MTQEQKDAIVHYLEFSLVTLWAKHNQSVRKQKKVEFEQDLCGVLSDIDITLQNLLQDQMIESID